MKNPTLFEKWQDGEKNGYLTDTEALELYKKLVQAEESAVELEAGKAVESYYSSLSYTLGHLLWARHIHPSTTSVSA